MRQTNQESAPSPELAADQTPSEISRRGFVAGTASAVGLASLAGASTLVASSPASAIEDAAVTAGPLSDYEIIEVTGRVTDEYGNPRAGAQIEIWHKHLSHWLDAGTMRDVSGNNPMGSTNHWYGCHTDADGNYAFCTFWPRKTADTPHMTDNLIFLQVETDAGERTVVPKQIDPAKATQLASGVPSFEINFFGRDAMKSTLS